MLLQNPFSYFLLFAVSATFVACGTSENNDSDEVINDVIESTYSPADLNNDLMTMLEGSISLVDEIFVSDSSDLLQSKENLLFELEIYENRLNEIEFEAGGDSFKSAVADLIDFYDDQFSNKFNDAEAILMKGDWTDEEDEILVAFDNAFADKEGILITTIEREQLAFSEAYSIQLVDREF